MRINDLSHARDGGVRSRRARIITHMDFINILSLDPPSSIELVILYAALCVAHAGLRFTAWKRGDGGVRQAYGNAVLHGHLCARGRRAARAIMMAVPVPVAELLFACH